MSDKLICNVCKQNKSTNEFYKNKKNKSGFDYRCKLCRKAQSSAWNRENVEKRKKIQSKNRHYNKDKENVKARQRYLNNIEYYREKSRKYNKIYYSKNKEKEKQRRKQYRKHNRDKVNASKRKWHANKMKTDECYALSVRLRSRLNKAIKNGYKSGSAVKDLGCSIAELKQHLEAQFLDCMTWENYGEWHIDHIKPLASFDLTDRKQLKQACHYTNLQPLWAKDNLKKNKF